MPFHYDAEVRIAKLQVGPYGNNCYLVICPTTNECAIIDTPPEPEKVLAALKGLKPKFIFITHNHQDHLVGYEQIKRGSKAPVVCHRADAAKLPSPAQTLLDGGETFNIGTFTLKAIHTPGHTPGSTCFLAGKHLFSGDTLFPGGPGRSATPADLRRILDSLGRYLFTLPDDTVVYPGHGDDTVLGKEKASYQAFMKRPLPPGLSGDVTWQSA